MNIWLQKCMSLCLYVCKCMYIVFQIISIFWNLFLLYTWEPQVRREALQDKINNMLNSAKTCLLMESSEGNIFGREENEEGKDYEKVSTIYTNVN